MPVSCCGGPQLSRQNQKPHGKNKIPHGKIRPEKNFGHMFSPHFLFNLPGVAFAFCRNRDIFISLMFEQIT